MADSFAQLFLLLSQTILPRLKEIQAAQEEQRLRSERLEQNINAFRAEMYLRFGELHAELAACRAQVEDVLVTFNESEAAAPNTEALVRGKKPLLN